jgi:hypothetical protein
VLRCMRQIVDTPDTDLFSDPHPILLRYLWPTDAYLYSQLWNPGLIQLGFS